MRMRNKSSHHISIDGLVVDVLTPGGNHILVDRGDVGSQLLILALVGFVKQ